MLLSGKANTKQTQMFQNTKGNKKIANLGEPYGEIFKKRIFDREE
jgi:hypothetical protein